MRKLCTKNFAALLPFKNKKSSFLWTMTIKKPISIMSVEISFIITVFNKEKYLPLTIRSIVRQAKHLNYEFIFVDDASTDASVSVIQKILDKSENFTMITNKDNLGPSIRLNEGCNMASGKYLFLMDADDILVRNALSVMLQSIKKEDADFIFGLNKVVELSQEELYKITLQADIEYKVSKFPLNAVLTNKYVRMSYLVKKDVYLKSGGADQTIFIQDESLPLRLAYHSKKMLTLLEPAIYGSKKSRSLSKNKLQQLHDKFYAYYNALNSFSRITNKQQIELYKRAISSVWKTKKINSSFKEKLCFFFFYLQTKMYNSCADIQILEKHKKYMDNLGNVRKTPYY